MGTWERRKKTIFRPVLVRVAVLLYSIVRTIDRSIESTTKGTGAFLVPCRKSRGEGNEDLLVLACCLCRLDWIDLDWIGLIWIGQACPEIVRGNGISNRY
jgi:hypothetical protein